MRLLLAIALLVAPLAAWARPFTIDDVLRMESYGQVLVDPAGTTLVFERRARYDSASSYIYDYFVRRLLSKLYAVNLQGTGPAAPLFRQDPQAGYWSGGFSPSGRGMAVFRLAKDRLSLGVLDMHSRAVRWLAVVPDLPDDLNAPIWIDETHLLVVTLRDRGMPAFLQTANAAQRSATRGWELAAEGKVASVRVQGSGRYQDIGTRYRQRDLVLLDLATGKQRVVFSGDVTDMALSADHRHLAITEKGPAIQPDPKLPVDPAFEPRRRRLAVLDLVTGAVARPCGGCDVIGELLHWSPAGADLLFFGRSDAADWDSGKLYRYDAAGGALTMPLPDGIAPVTQILAGSARTVHAAWAGDGFLVYAERAADRRRDWYRVAKASVSAVTAGLAAPSPALAALSPTHFFIAQGRTLWRGDFAGKLGKVGDAAVLSTGLTYFDPHSRGSRAWVNSVPGELAAITGDAEHHFAFRIGSSGDPRTTALDPADVLVAASGGTVIVFREDVRGVGSLLQLGAGTRTLDRVNTHLADIDAPLLKLLQTKGEGGTTLNHWLLLPAGAKAPPQLVVVPYPGFPYSESPPRDIRAATMNTMTGPLLLAAQGYAVLLPSIPLADGKGEPMQDIIRGTQSALDAVQASGLVSSAKPLLLGHSYGGYTVMALATATDCFAAVVATSGPYDLIAGYGLPDPRIDPGEWGQALTIPAGWYETGQGRMGSPPWRDVDRYVRNSPFFHIEDLHIPVLLSSADLDYVPVSEADQMFLALYRLGKDAVFLRYSGEAHSLSSPANMRDYWEHIFAFLREHQRR